MGKRRGVSVSSEKIPKEIRGTWTWIGFAMDLPWLVPRCQSAGRVGWREAPRQTTGWEAEKWNQPLVYIKYYTSSTAQGGGGSFKNRKPIGEIGCCESGMEERIH